MVLGGLAVASLAGMAIRVFEGFLGGLSKPIEMISNIIVFIAIVVIAFSVIVSGIGLELLTGNAWVAWLFFLGIGYAAANLIMSLFNL